jgi:RNA polymerase sigma factor (sigma-70 family)
LAALPRVGRATRVERPTVRGADAAGELYERYSGPIFGYCLHQLGSREEAEDAVQTTFMNAFRGLQRGIVPELESAWLFKIAHNVCLSRRRSTWRRGRVEAPNNLEVLQEVVPAHERIGDELIRLQDVLEEMPENQRRAILLREWQGLTYREIADELELSQSAVETLIFRARRALAAGLEEAPTDERKRGWRKPARRAGDVGAVAIALKTLVSGGGAKIAATALVAAATAIAGPIGNHHQAHHVRHASRVPSNSSQVVPRGSESKPAAFGSRRLAATASSVRHHATPAAPPRPTPASGGAPAPSLAPPPSPALTPPTPPSATPAADPKPQPSDETPAAPADEKAGKSEAPGQDHGNAPQPPATDPAAATPAGEHGKDAAPGQQDKGDTPGHGKGHK